MLKSLSHGLLGTCLNRNCLAATLALLALFAWGKPTLAQEPQHLGQFRDWHAFTVEENGNLVCFIVTRPTSEEGNYARRGDVYLMVTHRPAESSRDVVSIITGYTYEPGSEVQAAIANDTFSLTITEEDRAWAPDAETDAALVRAMIQGSSMTVRGRSNRGTLTTDSYSLLGFTAARDRIDEACGQ